MTATQQYLREAIKVKLRKLPKHKRKTAVFKIKTPRRLYPWSIERRYKKKIASYLGPLRRAVNAWIKEHGADLLKGDGISYHGDDSERLALHLDTIPGRGFQQFLSTLKGWMGMYFPELGSGFGPSPILIGLEDTADDIFDFNDAVWMRSMTAIIGTEFAANAEWYAAMKEAWVNNNYDLIRTVATRYIDGVNREVEKAIINGVANSDLAETLMGMGLGLEDWQASRLARDQIGKFNANITQAQNEEAGIDTYNWQTAGDEKVRGTPGTKSEWAVPNHFIMDGVLCRWDDASVYSDDDGKTWIPREPDMPDTHPGIDIQCRCTATTNINSIIDSVLKEMNSEEETAA
jgi:hypothetical protein